MVPWISTLKPLANLPKSVSSYLKSHTQCWHIFAAPEHKLARLTLDLVYLHTFQTVFSDGEQTLLQVQGFGVWAGVWCMSSCWLDRSVWGLGCCTMQQPSMASDWKSSKPQADEFFSSMSIMQLRRNGQYQALYQQHLQTRQIFPLIKSKNKQKKKLTSLIQPLHLCMKHKIRLIPSWSQLTEPLHICQSRLCTLQSAGWREEFYTLNSMHLKSIIDLGDASISLCPTKFEKCRKKKEGGKRGHDRADFSFCYRNEAKEAKEW